MYQEDDEKTFPFKGLLLKVVLVVLFIFVLMMLFPTKGYLTNYVDKKLKTEDNSNFNNNLLSMATVASGYYTSSRLPQNTGDKETMTLGDMLNKKMLVTLKDGNGNACSSKKSYVEVTKGEDEYTMKVNLDCGGESDYIVSHMALDGTSFPSTSTARCEFVKNLDGTWTYGPWSSWSTTKIEENSTTQVETSTKKIKSGVKNATKKEVETTPSTKFITNGKTVQYVCPSSYDNAGVYQNPTTCKKTTTVYTTVPNYKTVTYYRSRSKTPGEGNTDTKWSSCDDKDLINQGYQPTGNRE